LSDDSRDLAKTLRDRFPQAEAIDDSIFGQWLSQVVEFVEAPAIGLELPLDIGAPLFNERSGKPCANYRPSAQT